MSAYLNYFLEVNAGLLLFAASYWLLFRHDTDHVRKRAYLLAALLSALVFPMLHIAVPASVQEVGEITAQVPASWLPTLVVGDAALSTSAVPTLTSLWPHVLWVGSVVSLLVYLIKVFQLLFFLRRSTAVREGKLRVIQTDKPVTAFSFFHWVVLGNAVCGAGDRALVLRHEYEHARQWHSLDLFLSQIVIALCWFNPAAYWLRKALRDEHEYQADAAVMADQPGTAYEELLVRLSLHHAGFGIVNHFNHALTLKRIKLLQTMKKNIQPWKWAAVAATAVLFFMLSACRDSITISNDFAGTTYTIENVPATVQEKLTALQHDNPDREVILLESTDTASMRPRLDTVNMGRLFAVHGVKDSTDSHVRNFVFLVLDKDIAAAGTDDILTVVEQPAAPANGIEEFMTWLGKEIKYPAAAKAAKITGKVMLEFVVQKDGSISDIKVLTGIGGGCDEEAVRAMKLSPPWNPGQQRGVAVTQKMVLPILFNLEGTPGDKPSMSQADMGYSFYHRKGSDGSTLLEGKVFEGETPIANVNVVLEGTTEGTYTDANGLYHLSTKATSGRLVFSHINYKTKAAAFDDK